MKTITIRDLRQHWPKTEAALKVEKEVLITRDAKPVAKLTYISPAQSPRPPWDAAAHARWQRKVAGGKISRSDIALAESRADRQLAGAPK